MTLQPARPQPARPQPARPETARPETARPLPPAPAFAPAEVSVRVLADGSQLVTSPQPLGAVARCLGDFLSHWAARQPDALFLAEREPQAPHSWRRLTWGEALTQVRSLAQALLDRGLGPADTPAGAERPVMILSDNSIDHALLALAAQHVGIPVAPVSPAYSLMSRDHEKLRGIFAALTPGLVWCSDGAQFARALAALPPRTAAGDPWELVTSHHGPDGATPFASLLAAIPGPAVDAAHGAVGPETVGKILFTSGSTGTPKGVINTQRMMCSNQQQIRQCWPFLEQRQPVLVDWLPWNHTFGGNHNFNLVLANGGTLYIDNGKPVPGAIEHTVANLRDVSPTLYFNVPRGFDVLLSHLEADRSLAERLFARLDLIFYAGAALPQSLWERLERLSLEVRGDLVALVSAWGSTETAPMVTTVHFPLRRAGVIGLPAPGAELKLVPNGDKLEMRVRGPNVTPGYWRDPERTAAAFDEDGYYLIGDAGRFEDPARPEAGIVFDGRVSENFKLSTGTWVHVGTLRTDAITALAPVAQDCVITGHDRDQIGLLVFPNLAGCRMLTPDLPADAPIAAVLGDDRVRAHVAAALSRHNQANQGSSQRLSRVLLLEVPPSIDSGEITDKGYLNQRRVLACRADRVARLYGDDPAVILPARA